MTRAGEGLGPSEPNCGASRGMTPYIDICVTATRAAEGIAAVSRGA